MMSTMRQGELMTGFIHCVLGEGMTEAFYQNMPQEMQALFKDEDEYLVFRKRMELPTMAWDTLECGHPEASANKLLKALQDGCRVQHRSVDSDHRWKNADISDIRYSIENGSRTVWAAWRIARKEK